MVIELKYWNFEKLFPPISIFLFFNEKWTRWGKERSLQDWGIFFAFLFTSKLQFIAICALGPTASALHLSLQPFKLYFLVVFSAGRPLGYFMDYLIWNEVWLGLVMRRGQGWISGVTLALGVTRHPLVITGCLWDFKDVWGTFNKILQMGETSKGSNTRRGGSNLFPLHIQRCQ